MHNQRTGFPPKFNKKFIEKPIKYKKFIKKLSEKKKTFKCYERVFKVYNVKYVINRLKAQS